MDYDAKYGPFLKAMSGADSVQARRFAAAKALEIGWGGVSKVSVCSPETFDFIYPSMGHGKEE